MTTVEATMHLANPYGGPPLAKGDRAEVDETDPTVKAYLEQGMLVKVKEDATQAWTEAPSENWTKDQLRAEAERRGIQVPDSATKAELLREIQASDQPSGG